MKKYQVTFRGESPLLLHCDNPMWRDQIKKWTANPMNKKTSIAGDDRTPSWTWIGCLYHDNKNIGLPSDNIMTCIRDGATMVTVSGKKTFKAQSQSGILVNEILWPIKTPNGFVNWDDVIGLVDEPEFDKHTEHIQSLGFDLFVKPARVNRTKHIRVRPRFDTWEVTGSVTVFDEMITKTILKQILTMAGQYCGIGDWRPKSPMSPGQFGRFGVSINEIK